MNLITLHEYDESSHELADHDATWINRHLAPRISIREDFESGGFWLNPGSHVGVVELPSGFRLECQPKVSVSNFFYMLAVAFDLDPEFLEGTTGFEGIDEMYEFVARYLAGLVNQKIDHGLYRTYREREDNLTTVRGRIATVEDMRRNHILRHRTYCRFTEFTWDIPENQIIRQVVHLLSRRVTSRDLRRSLRRIDRRLFEVTPTQLPAAVVDRFTYHRLNRDYRQIHQLCKLFLESSSVSEHAGKFDFRTFLFDMNVVYERFITKKLQRILSPELQVLSQYRSFLDRSRQISIRPDLLMRSNMQEHVLVGDCKYKRLSEDEFKNADFYQIVSYCTALNLHQGILIYPKDEIDRASTVDIAHSPIRIHQLTVDLGVNRSQLKDELSRLGQSVLDLANDANSEWRWRDTPDYVHLN